MRRPGFRTVPGWVVIPAGAGALLVLLPLAGVLLRVDWGHLGALLTAESSVTALLLSLRTALASTALCLVVGCPLALVLARSPLRGLSVLRSLVLLPLVLPPVVGGIALLYTFGRMGLLGPPLRLLGIDIAFTTAAVVLAQTFVALPFLVVSLEGALRTVGTRYERVAAGLGASPTRTLFRVTLPLTLPAVLSGAALSFARCLGEFGATLTFAGSLEGVTRTLPLEIYLRRETDPDQAVALSLLLVVVALLVVGLSAPSRRRRGAGFRAGLTRWFGPPGHDEEKRPIAAPAEPAAAGPAAPAPATEPAGEGQRTTSAAAGTAGSGASAPGWAPPPVAPWPGKRSGASQRADSGLDVAVALAERGVSAAFTVPAGRTLALLGPNGVGKSTVVALIAGLLAPDRGRVRIGGRGVVEVVDGKPGTWTPAHRRGVALMAQEPLLFPHLSVLDNVAFGPRCAGAGRAQARLLARHWLRETGAERFAQRRPGELSGGQAQRVAIARVLAAAPDVVLLDEPLSALDVTARPELRRVLRRVLAGRTAVIITHDPRDVEELADRVLRLAPDAAPVTA